MLVGCIERIPIPEELEGITATGAIEAGERVYENVRDAGILLKEGTTEVIDEATERADKISRGAKMLGSGATLLREGLSTNE